MTVKKKLIPKNDKPINKTTNRQNKNKIMNQTTLFYLLPEYLYTNILKHLDRETRAAILCLIYYGDKLDLWYKWYPLTLK